MSRPRFRFVCIPKAISIDVCQGCTCGEGEVWKRVVVFFSDTIRGRNTPCLEQIGLREPRRSLSDDIEVTRETLLKLGRGKACARRI